MPFMARAVLTVTLKIRLARFHSSDPLPKSCSNPIHHPPSPLRSFLYPADLIIMRKITRIILIQLIILHKFPIEATKLIHLSVRHSFAGMIVPAGFDTFFQ